MYNPVLMETILKALREQSKEDDQVKSVEELAQHQKPRLIGMQC